jgi:hypothetical protein
MEEEKAKYRNIDEIKEDIEIVNRKIEDKISIQDNLFSKYYKAKRNYEKMLETIKNIEEENDKILIKINKLRSENKNNISDYEKEVNNSSYLGLGIFMTVKNKVFK